MRVNEELNLFQHRRVTPGRIGLGFRAMVVVATAVLGLGVPTPGWAIEPLIEMKLWPGVVPGEASDDWDDEALAKRSNSESRLEVVTEPTITVYSPTGTPNGTAVVVAPGGGYNILAIEKEGTEIAEWLNGEGITAVVLKYRVPRRDKDRPHWAPLQDAQRAMRLVRKYATAWSIHPERVGFLGFSAGGHLTLTMGTAWKTHSYTRVDDADALSCRPDFIVPVYPAYMKQGEEGVEHRGGLREEFQSIPADAPPMFMVHAFDDKDRAIHAALLYAKYRQVGVASELHIYSIGGHGYGLRPSPNPVSRWHQRCREWMRVSGWLD